MAERMQVRPMVDFVSSSSPLLNLVGAEGLYALASGPIGQHDNIAFAGGVQALIYLIRRPAPDGTPVIAGRPVSYSVEKTIKREQPETAYVHQGEYGLDPKSVYGYGLRTQISSKI